MVSAIKRIFIVSLVLSSTLIEVAQNQRTVFASADNLVDLSPQGQSLQPLQSSQPALIADNSQSSTNTSLEPSTSQPSYGVPVSYAAPVGRQTEGLLSPPYASPSPLPMRGLTMYYNPGIMQRVVDYRKRIGQLTPCEECIGYIAMLRKGDINRRVWFQFADGTLEGPFLVADVAHTKDIPRLLSLGWAVDVDYETAVRWRFLMRPVTIREYTYDSSTSYTQPAVNYTSPAEPARTEAVSVQMVITQPTLAQPTLAPQQIIAPPVTTQPVVEQPISPQPVVAQPVSTVPVNVPATVVQPVAEPPAFSQPAVSPPNNPQPSATQPNIEPKPVDPPPDTSHPSQPAANEPPVAEQPPPEPQPIEAQPVEAQPIEPQPVEPQPIEAIEPP